MLLPFIGLSQDILISEGGTVNTCSGTLYDYYRQAWQVETELYKN